MLRYKRNGESIHTTGYIIRIIPVVINHKILLVLGIYARCSSIYGRDSNGQNRICSWYPCDVDCTVWKGWWALVCTCNSGTTEEKGENVIIS